MFSTAQNTKSSAQLQALRRGRVSKSRSRRGYVNNTSSLLSEKINGLSRNSNKFPDLDIIDESQETAVLLRESEQRTIHYPQGRKRSLFRAALLSSGIVGTVGLAVLLSTSSSISWDKLSLPALQLFNGLREKLYNLLH